MHQSIIKWSEALEARTIAGIMDNAIHGECSSGHHAKIVLESAKRRLDAARNEMIDSIMSGKCAHREDEVVISHRLDDYRRAFLEG